MGHDHTRESRGEQQHTLAPAWRRFYWAGLCLFLLAVACSNNPAPPSVTPTATMSTPPTTSTAYHGHTSTVFTVAFSPDGRRIASGSDDSTVQVWEATSGKLLLTYRGHTAGVRALAWSPDGTRLVSGGNDSTVQVWDATSGRRLGFRQYERRTSYGNSAGVECRHGTPHCQLPDPVERGLC